MNTHTKTPNIAVVPLGDQLAEGTARNALRRLSNRLRPRWAGAVHTHGTEQSNPCPRPASVVEVRAKIRHRCGQVVTVCVKVNPNTTLQDLYPVTRLSLCIQHQLSGVEILQIALPHNYAHAPATPLGKLLAEAKAKGMRNG